MTYRCTAIFADANSALLEEARAQWPGCLAREVAQPFVGIAVASPLSDNCWLDVYSNSLGTEYGARVEHSMKDDLQRWSSAHPAVVFVLIEAECWGGHCSYSGYACQNGTIISEESGEEALSRLVKYLGVTFSDPPRQPFEPFERGFFHSCRTMRYVIVDLEATCWDQRTATERMETIEIGALILRSASGPIDGEFNSFVKPLAAPILSDFCKSLTSIAQDQVDSADYFSIVFPKFVEWIGHDTPFILCSWGAYDLTQLKADCNRSSLQFPRLLENHINLKKEFARINGTRPLGMAQALSHAQMPLLGTHHRGIDDARNIAQIAMSILPQIEIDRSQLKQL